VQIFKDRGSRSISSPISARTRKSSPRSSQLRRTGHPLGHKVSAKTLEKAKNLKVIGRAGIGVDNVDIPAATARGIIVMNTPFGNSITTAEHAISLMLALARQIPEADTSTAPASGKRTSSSASKSSARRSASSAAAISARSSPTAPSG